MDRRALIGAAGALPLLACAPKHRVAGLPPGDWLGVDPAFGHRLQTPAGDERFDATADTEVLIAGAGIGGLSAAWWFTRAGIDDFMVADLQSAPGGNARGGGNSISRYPLGAHYLPLPTRESATLRRLLSDLGALEGAPDSVRPRYAERLLVAAPQERLLRFGHWQEGIVPEAGLTAAERGQMQAFFELVARFRRRSAAGKAFALPMAASKVDGDALALDHVSFATWLRGQGLNSEPLHWYVDYACRDDFGTPAAMVSAWAGLHYFAARDGEAEGASSDVVLTAPEGNGWITEGLAARIGGERLQCNAIVRRVRAARSGYESWVEGIASGRTCRVRSKAIVWAGPLFVAPRVIEGLPDSARDYAARIDYAPWVMAQLSLHSSPPERPGAQRAWDNVLYGSRSLGYVVATHQRLSAAQAPTVWTWYHSLQGAPSKILRRELLAQPREHWAAMALSELAPAYPDLADHVSRIDCIRHGHAMARPLPGFLADPARHWFARGLPTLQFAHADVSGFSVCEEAHARGVSAAERIAAALSGRKPDPQVIFDV